MNSAMPGVAKTKSICFETLKCVFSISGLDSVWRSARMLLSPQFWMYVAIEPSIEPSTWKPFPDLYL
jgi:hypothetical protein